MTINMNKKCRGALGGHEALLRDNIDMKIMRWIDSISASSHTDHEIVARATTSRDAVFLVSGIVGLIVTYNELRARNM